MYIKDIMTKDIVTVLESDTVEKCAKILHEHKFSGLPVVDEDGMIKGIVTEGDIIKRASRMKGPSYLEILGGIVYLESAKDLMEEVQRTKGNLVGDIMTKDVRTIKEDEEIEDAATLLVKEKIKRLPVVGDEGRLIGIVARRDIMEYLFNNK